MTTWPPGPVRPEPVQVGVAAALHEPAAAARRARPVAGSSAVHSSPAARSSASVVLPTPAGPTSSDRVRRPARDHRPDRRERGRMAPGPSAVHDRRGQAGSVGRLAGRSGASGRRRRPLRRRRPAARPRRPSPCPRRAAASAPPSRASALGRLRPRRRRRSRPRVGLAAWRPALGALRPRLGGSPRPPTGAGVPRPRPCVVAALRGRLGRRAPASARRASGDRPRDASDGRRRRAALARLGQLGPEHRLELRRDLAPRFARRGRGARPIAAARARSGAVARPAAAAPRRPPRRRAAGALAGR